jgi:hypothetical protein
LSDQIEEDEIGQSYTMLEAIENTGLKTGKGERDHLGDIGTPGRVI